MAITVNTPHNPIAPATAPSADEVLNAYQAHAASIRGEAQEEAGDVSGYNPYAPAQDTQQDAQQAHISSMEQFLAPVPMNQYDLSGSNTDENKRIFADHIEHDPAFKEFGGDYIDKLEVLRQGIASGHIDMTQARQMVASYGQEVIDPVLEKHHGKHSDTHKISMFDAAHAEKLKGGK